MDMSPSAQRTLVAPGRRAHVEDLLCRYPAIDAGEAAEILAFLKKGPPLEVALMTADDRISPKVRQFRDDHRSHFSLGLREYAAVAVIFVGLVVLLGFLWDWGLGR